MSFRAEQSFLKGSTCLTRLQKQHSSQEGASVVIIVIRAGPAALPAKCRAALITALN